MKLIYLKFSLFGRLLQESLDCPRATKRQNDLVRVDVLKCLFRNFVRPRVDLHVKLLHPLNYPGLQPGQRGGKVNGGGWVR